MQLLCMDCLKVYRHYDIEEGNESGYQVGLCNKLKCRGSVVEVDELILPTLIELNKKGYYTYFCCSGHLWGDSGNISFYIYFREGCSPEEIPEGFKYDEKNLYTGGRSVRYRTKKFNGASKLKRYKQLFEINLAFYEHALKLPHRVPQEEKELVLS